MQIHMIDNHWTSAKVCVSQYKDPKSAKRCRHLQSSKLRVTPSSTRSFRTAIKAAIDTGATILPALLPATDDTVSSQLPPKSREKTEQTPRITRKFLPRGFNAGPGTLSPLVLPPRAEPALAPNTALLAMKYRLNRLTAVGTRTETTVVIRPSQALSPNRSCDASAQPLQIEPRNQNLYHSRCGKLLGKLHHH
ncbi:hypothetical protein H4582DRAFT_638849 [Lactarius indigo]|nr:hypothetical protein H4582DRAFT_638849 [Lactarius indigo]